LAPAGRLTKLLLRDRVTYIEVPSRYSRSIVEEKLEVVTPAFIVVSTGPGRLKLVGELDMDGVPVLRALLAGLEGDIEIDCSGLTFIDCAGLRVLEVARRSCEVAGVRLSLVAPPRCVTRWLVVAGLGGFFGIRDSLGS
jgi:anti-anti-sigma factor